MSAQTETQAPERVNITCKPPELEYKYEPPSLNPIPRNVALGDQHVPDILKAIESGMTMREVCRAIDRDVSALSLLLSRPQHSARARESRRLSAVYWDEQAETELKKIKDDDTKAAVARSRELASHYRWRARSIAPADYNGVPPPETGSEQLLAVAPAELIRAALSMAVQAGLAHQMRGLLPPGAIDGQARLVPDGPNDRQEPA